MKFGLIIVVAALFGTIILGSVAIDRETVEVVSYERVADLTPIVKYDTVNDVINYNPAGNVIGWQNVTFQTQGTPTIYPVTTYGTTTTQTTGTMASYGGYYFKSDAAYGYHNSESWYVVWNDSTKPSNGSVPSHPGWDNPGTDNMMGGYSSSDSYQLPGYGGAYREAAATVQVVQPSGTVIKATNASPIWWQPLSKVAQADSWPTGSVVTISSGIAVLKSLTLEGRYLQQITSNLHNDYRLSYATQTLELGTASAASYWWDAEVKCFYPITGTDPQNNPIYSGVKTQLVWYGSDSSVTLTYKEHTPGSTVFVKPYTDVSIASGAVATWSNGYANTQVQIIVEPTATIAINSSDEDTFWQISLPDSAYAYEKVLVTLGPEPYWQGITSYSNPVQYTVVPYQYPLEYGIVNKIQLYYTGPSTSTNYSLPTGTYTQLVANSSSANDSVSISWVIGDDWDMDYLIPGTGTYTIGPDGEWYVVWGVSADPNDAALFNFYYRDDLPVNWRSIESIQSLTVSNTSMAAIVNTWMPSDPMERLWKNPNLTPLSYFPDIFEGTGARVIISSVLTTGTTMGIGGINYPTEDYKIYYDGAWHKLNGLAIDYTDNGDIVFVDVDGNSYVAGTWDENNAASTKISFTGTWYFSSALYDKTLSSKGITIFNFGESATAGWLGFAFCGLCIGGAVAVLAVGRGSLDIWDWVILLASIALSLVVIM